MIDSRSPRATDRCAWCGRTESGLVALPGWTWGGGSGPVRTHIDHAAAMTEYLELTGAGAPRLVRSLVALTLVAILVGVVGMAAGVALATGVAWSTLLVGAYAIAAGVFLWRWPVAAPILVRRVGARHALRVTRTFAVALLVVGLAVATAGLAVG